MLAEGIILHVLTVKLMLFKHCANDPPSGCSPLVQENWENSYKKNRGSHQIIKNLSVFLILA